jgi:hypothetical protein
MSAISSSPVTHVADDADHTRHGSRNEGGGQIHAHNGVIGARHRSMFDTGHLSATSKVVSIDVTAALGSGGGSSGRRVVALARSLTRCACIQCPRQSSFRSSDDGRRQLRGVRLAIRGSRSSIRVRIDQITNSTKDDAVHDYGNGNGG